MGLGYGAVVDPQSGVRNNVLAVIYGNVALMTFFMIDGHHAFLRALHHSYAALPVGTGGIGASLPQSVAQMLGLVFTVGARLAAPVIIVVVIVEIAMAMLARSAPALNVMVAGAPVRIFAGLVMLALIVPSAAGVIAGLSESVVRLATETAAAFR
jgi:flagellar biosynthetic protein FliR